MRLRTALAYHRRKQRRVDHRGRRRWLTLAQWAEESGYSEQYLSELERGSRRGAPHTWEAVAPCLGLTPEQAQKLAAVLT